MVKATKFFGGMALISCMALTAVGCDDEKKADPTAAASSAKPAASAAAAASGSAAAKPADAPEEKKAAAPAGEVGATLAYMPKECPVGRVFVNMAGVDQKARGSMDDIQEKLMASLSGGDAEKAGKVMEVLKEGGFEPGELREISACISKADDPVIAIGMGDKVKEPLELIAKAVEAAGQPKPELSKDGDVGYMEVKKGEDGVLSNPTAGVILIGKNKDILSKLAKGGDGASEFKDAKDFIVWASVSPSEREPSVDLTIKDAGENYDAIMGVTMKGPPAEQMKKDPEKFVEEIKKQRDGMAKQIEGSPFKALSEPMKAAEFKVDGDKLTINASIGKKLLEELGNTLKDMKPEELMKAL